MIIRVLFLCAFLLTPVSAQADDKFDTWVAAFKADAKRKGISQDLLDQVFTGVKPVARIIELDRKQPEGTMSFAQYKKRVISDARIAQGRRMYREHRELLDVTAKKYGVPAQYIVALWGVETSYGNNTGGFDVVTALSTLAYDGRRAKFFRKELINALKILDAGHITHKDMKGSWAGAMGQNQFMPSSFHAYAVDGNADGKRNIWTSLPDVFASTANYLSKSGWREEELWGRRVALPKSLTKAQIGRDKKKTLKEWKRLGVTLPNGADIPVVDGFKAAVIAPDGLNGPAYFVYHNFGVVLKWNRSNYFATSVGILADAIVAE